MRIALSSSTFRRPLAAGELTQLEWLERSASALGVDGVLAAVEDFPRTDAEYVAQLRKVAIDLGVVPFGIDAGSLFDAGVSSERRDGALALATAFGAAVIRTTLPPPGDVPPATFVDVARSAKSFARAAKLANVTVLVATAPGTLGDDAAGVKHFVKDVDSAWIRATPSVHTEAGAKERIPAFTASPDDEPAVVVARARRAWLLLDVPPGDTPWEAAGEAIGALRRAEAGEATRPQRPS
ncbi:MAG TPA: hypothetical protein VHT53_08650 [Candidatus Elarobacter sp.]|nr:hypothetical protein [Candidatus Elarobacter sp.]